MSLASGNPFSFLHVARAEIDLPPGTDPYSDAVYSKAAQSFRELEQTGTLIREEKPCLFVYRQKMGGHSQSGIVACCHIQDYETNVIRKHEKTLPAKENDRMRHICGLNAQAEPVFVVFRDTPAITRILTETEATAALYDFTAADGIRHTVWRLPGAKGAIEAFAAVPQGYIADGHHRFAAAVRLGRERRAANQNHTGTEEYNWVLATIFPASQLKILAYNRVVSDLNRMKPGEFLAKLDVQFELRPAGRLPPATQGRVNMYLDGHWYELAMAAATRADTPKVLDVAALQERLLAPILGIDDPRTSKRIDFVGGLNSVDELVRRVDSGRWAVAFSMHPVTIDDVMTYSDAGLIMPPKSTWFEPKLRSGLFAYTL